jgi:alkylmercury lyase
LIIMTQNEMTAGDEWWESHVRWLPVFSAKEQRAGSILHRALAKGEPVTFGQYARALGTSVDAAVTLVTESALRPFVYTDETGQITGFWGLSVVPTRHRLAVDGRTLWTWCAQDSLFIPELLGEIAEIESRDPENDQPIRLTVSPERVEAASTSGIVVSIGRPETWDASSATRIITTACHHIFFFTSRASGERWQEKHPGPETILLSLDEAVCCGKRSNAHLFGAELAQRSGDMA